MNLDVAIYAQIQPYLLESRNLGLNDEQGRSLVADLYTCMFNYTKALKGYVGQIDHLESLKAGKAFQKINNICDQQKAIMEKSEEKKHEILCETYNNWIDKNIGEIDEIIKN